MEDKENLREKAAAPLVFVDRPERVTCTAAVLYQYHHYED